MKNLEELGIKADDILYGEPRTKLQIIMKSGAVMTNVSTIHSREAFHELWKRHPFVLKLLTINGNSIIVKKSQIAAVEITKI